MLIPTKYYFTSSQTLEISESDGNRFKTGSSIIDKSKNTSFLCCLRSFQNFLVLASSTTPNSAFTEKNWISKLNFSSERSQHFELKFIRSFVKKKQHKRIVFTLYGCRVKRSVLDNKVFGNPYLTFPEFSYIASQLSHSCSATVAKIRWRLMNSWKFPTNQIAQTSSVAFAVEYYVQAQKNRLYIRISASALFRILRHFFAPSLIRVPIHCSQPEISHELILNFKLAVDSSGTVGINSFSLKSSFWHTKVHLWEG